jgi:sulfur carrier protein ThiS adenylyltransferase
MNTNYVKSTVRGIISEASFDINFAKYITTKESDGDDGNIYKDTYDFTEQIYNYFCANHIYMSGYIESMVSVRLTNFLNSILNNSSQKIYFTQAINPYSFKVSNGVMVIYLPALITRSLLRVVKTLGLKCEVYKKSRKLCSKENIFFSELTYTGDTKEDIEELVPLKKVFKEIKVKVNPWFKENEYENVEQLNVYNDNNLRFRGAEWFESAQRNVTLIGCGGLGSNIAVSLCRVLGDNTLVLYDPDRVEQKNLAGQNFGINNIGCDKAAVVKEQCINFNPGLSVLQCGRYQASSALFDIVITGLDNMATRQLVFYKWKDQMAQFNDTTAPNSLLIDARLSAEKWQIFCISGDNKKAQDEYENKWLFSDDEAESDVCSYKQTAYAAQMCASFVTNLYINFCSNRIKLADDPTKRYLPFMTEYDATQMILRTKEII